MTTPSSEDALAADEQSSTPELRPRCWICGALATTGEHKIKQSDLKRVHGRGKDFADQQLSYLRHTGEVVPLQGPNADCIKYPLVLCAPCNNVGTQPDDRAYERFIDYIEEHGSTIIETRSLDFAQVFPGDVLARMPRLYRYFVKQLGCRIRDAGGIVPEQMSAFMRGESGSLPLWVCFLVDETGGEQNLVEQTNLAIGNIVHTAGAEGSRFVVGGWFRWLVVMIGYEWPVFDEAGTLWAPGITEVSLGAYSGEFGSGGVPGQDGSNVSWPGL